MTKKEIAEVRRTIKQKTGCIRSIHSYYITSDKKCVAVPMPSAARMSEDESDYYFNIFKKVLSGSIGKQLNTLAFPNEAEQEQQACLLTIRDSELQDEQAIEALCRSIITSYITDDCYCILLLQGCYDIPVRNRNDTEEGESDYVYNYIIGCICPTSLSKPCLSYDAANNQLASSSPVRMVSSPDFGFVFPAFIDRGPDIHHVLTYSRRGADVDADLYSSILGCRSPMSQDEEVSTFAQLTETAFGGSCGFNDAANIHMSLYDLLCENEDSGHAGQPLTVDKKSLEAVMQENSASDIESFKDQYTELLGEQEIHVESIVNPKKAVIKTPEFTITGPTDALSLVTVREVDGMKCLVIQPNGGTIEINGVPTQG